MKKRSIFPSIILYIAGLLLVGGLIYYFVQKDPDILKVNIFAKNAAFRAESLYSEGEVYVDNKLLGTTPLETKELKSGEHTFRLKNGENQYETSIKVLPTTEVIISRELGVSEVFSSGQNFWLEKGKSDAVLSVISEPSNATVFIDNTEVGKTPYSASNLTEGEYDLKVSLSGYDVTNSRINIQKDHKLNVSFTLFPIPVPAVVRMFEGSENLYDLALDNMAVTSNVSNWVKAVIYWNETRGINLEGLGLNKERVFDYYMDYKGTIYGADGSVVTDLTVLQDADKGAYLGRLSDGSGLTPEAKEAYEELTGKLVGTQTATILPTGFGWLRVRSSAGLDGVEIGRVDEGETFTVLENAGGWVKIKLADDSTGWVSEEYVELSE